MKDEKTKKRKIEETEKTTSLDFVADSDKKSKQKKSKNKTESKLLTQSKKEGVPAPSSNWLLLKETIPKTKQPSWKLNTQQKPKKREESAESVLKPLSEETRVTKYLGLDCEMVGVEGGQSILARVVIVNSFGNLIYDKFVKPKEKVFDYRTWVSGIRSGDLKDAYPFEQAQKEVADLIKDRIVVGHALEHDFRALLLSHPFSLTRDTAKYRPFQRSKGKPRKLKFLTKKYLGITIQSGEHKPDEDARAALALYKHFKKEWEGTITKKILKKSKKKSQTKDDNVMQAKDLSESTPMSV